MIHKDILAAAGNALVAMGTAGVWFALGALTHKLYTKRTHRRSRKLDDAQLAADLLRGYTCVNGIDLPLPGAAAWTCETRRFTKGPEIVLALGDVLVNGNTREIFSGPGRCLTPTDATRAYAHAVWHAYRNRCARAAIEKAGT